MDTFVLPAGSVVKLNGFPVALKEDTTVESGTPESVIRSDPPTAGEATES